METQPMTKKDYTLGFLAGLLIGLLFLPVLSAAKPDLYQIVVVGVVPFFLIATPFGLAIAHVISRKIPVAWQLGKFGVTGVLNVLVDLGVLSLLTYFFRNYYGIDSETAVISFLTFYSFYKAVSFIVANINSYLWNKHWTFNKEGGKSTEFIQFFIVSVVGFAINVLVASLVFKAIASAVGLSTDQAGLIGPAMGSIIGLAWNFIGYKFIVFKK